MALILDDEYTNTHIRTTVKYCEALFNEKMNDIRIVPTTDIAKDITYFIENTENKPVNPNGLFIEPNPKTSNPTILIKSELFHKNDCQAISTLIHELTHSSDYKKYCAEYCNSDWSILRFQPSFPGMYLWSEYHARITQIIHMRILIAILLNNEEIATQQNVKKDLIKYLLPQYKQELADVLNSNKNSFSLVELFKYCARFYVCQLYDNKLKIEDHVPTCVYDYFPDIIKLYYDLHPLQTYEEASKNFKFLSLMLRDFW